MIIEKNISAYIILEESSILEALNKINTNNSRILLTALENSRQLGQVVSCG
jgi:hypothetical protein